MPNLLTPQEKKKLHREYRLRVLATALALFFVALVFTIGELLPSYYFMSAELSIMESRLENLKGAQEIDTETNNPGATLQETKVVLNTLEPQVEDVPYRTTVLREVLELRPSGMQVSSLSFERTPEGEGVLAISGQANRRDTLTSFVRSVEENPRFTNVQVPVESLAQTENIPFSIRLTGAF